MAAGGGGVSPGETRDHILWLVPENVRHEAFQDEEKSALAVKVSAVAKVLFCRVLTVEAFKTAIKEHGPGAKGLIISAHGEIDSMELSVGNYLRRSDLSEETFAPLSDSCRFIVCKSCNTAHGIAQDIAKLSKIPTLAPRIPITRRITGFHPLFPSGKYLFPFYFTEFELGKIIGDGTVQYEPKISTFFTLEHLPEFLLYSDRERETIFNDLLHKHGLEKVLEVLTNSEDEKIRFWGGILLILNDYVEEGRSLIREGFDDRTLFEALENNCSLDSAKQLCLAQKLSPKGRKDYANNLLHRPYYYREKKSEEYDIAISLLRTLDPNEIYEEIYKLASEKEYVAVVREFLSKMSDEEERKKITDRMRLYCGVDA